MIQKEEENEEEHENLMLENVSVVHGPIIDKLDIMTEKQLGSETSRKLNGSQNENRRQPLS